MRNTPNHCSDDTINKLVEGRFDFGPRKPEPRHMCEVCGADTEHDHGRCTNNRCAKCHREHCGVGGITTPGHARGTVPTPFAK